MDYSREHDLYALKHRMDDETLPPYERKKAYRSFRKIEEQKNSNELAELRHRLIKATKAGDTTCVEKLSKQIDELTYRKGWR